MLNEIQDDEKNNVKNQLPAAIDDFSAPINSIDAYLQRINQIPLLTQEEEHKFAVELQENNDLAAARRLILPHLRYVVRVAKGYLGYGLPLADLVQEGNIGLMKAVRRFNPNMGVRLVTFAMHSIKAEIHEYILRNWRIVKIATTKAQRKLFFNLRHLKKRLGWMTQQEVNDIARDLGVKPETVREMEMRLTHHDMSFEVSDDDDDQGGRGGPMLAPIAYLEDHRHNPEATLLHADWSAQASDHLYEAINTLDERSQDIIRSRWLNEDKLTLQDLAEKHALSAERIRQLEKKAMEKLRLAVGE